MVDLHLDSLYRFALRLTHNRAEAEDVVQDTCVRAFRSFHRFSPGTNGRAWLFTILRNAFVDNLRRRRAAQVLELLDDDAHAVPETPPPALSQRFDDGDLWSAVELLPDELRAAFCLHVRDGADYVAIAARLGIAKSTVGTRLFRARRALRELMVA